MKRTFWLGMLVFLAGCSSGSHDAATLVLHDPFWDTVHVEAVITTSDNCDYRGKGYLKTEHFVMTKHQTYSIVAPQAQNICWRHDLDPDNPRPGAWTGWARATMYPGQTANTDL